MTADAMVKQLKYLDNEARLKVIEAASRLMRDELTVDVEKKRKERARRLRKAALAVKDIYENDPEMTIWTCLDGEEFLDDTSPR